MAKRAYSILQPNLEESVKGNALHVAGWRERRGGGGGRLDLSETRLNG